MLSIQTCNLDFNSFVDVAYVKITSSASIYITQCEVRDIIDNNKIGPRTDPCGTPHLKPRSHMHCNLSATALRLKNSCNQCNHCAIKTAFFRLQINRRLVGDNYPKKSATGGRLIANWLEMGCDWSAPRWRLVGDRSVMSWRLTIEQTICCVGVIMNKALMNYYSIKGHQHIDYVISFIWGLFSG